MKRALIVAALLAASTTVASAEAYLRVIAQKASVHSGPGNGYREVAVANRNQVFEVLERGTNGYWFKVELDDGTSGWILGDVVYPFEVGEEEEPGDADDDEGGHLALVSVWCAVREGSLHVPVLPR